MPPIRSSRNRKPPPAGFEDIEDTLLEFDTKLKDATNASHEGKKRYETTWPIFQITHQRSRYIYDLYYEKEAISKQLYDWLLKNQYADANLIAKWKKQGYEKVCFAPTTTEWIGILTHDSCAAWDASRPRRPISRAPASAECRSRTSKKTTLSNVSAAVAVDAPPAIERRPFGTQTTHENSMVTIAWLW